MIDNFFSSMTSGKYTSSGRCTSTSDLNDSHESEGEPPPPARAPSAPPPQRRVSPEPVKQKASKNFPKVYSMDKNMYTKDGISPAPEDSSSQQEANLNGRTEDAENVIPNGHLPNGSNGTDLPEQNEAQESAKARQKAKKKFGKKDLTPEEAAKLKEERRRMKEEEKRKRKEAEEAEERAKELAKQAKWEAEEKVRLEEEQAKAEAEAKAKLEKEKRDKERKKAEAAARAKFEADQKIRDEEAKRIEEEEGRKAAQLILAAKKRAKEEKEARAAAKAKLEAEERAREQEAEKALQKKMFEAKKKAKAEREAKAAAKAKLEAEEKAKAKEEVRAARAMAFGSKKSSKDGTVSKAKSIVKVKKMKAKLKTAKDDHVQKNEDIMQSDTKEEEDEFESVQCDDLNKLNVSELRIGDSLSATNTPPPNRKRHLESSSVESLATNPTANQSISPMTQQQPLSGEQQHLKEGQNANLISNNLVFYTLCGCLVMIVTFVF